jgi:hypothetical protein
MEIAQDSKIEELESLGPEQVATELTLPMYFISLPMIDIVKPYSSSLGKKGSFVIQRSNAYQNDEGEQATCSKDVSLSLESPRSPSPRILDE